MKQFMTAESAIDTFIKCKKEGKEIPQAVFESLRNYRKWKESSLQGLINASAYFPEIFIEAGMEENTEKLLEDFKKRIVPHKK